jgi:hypothetical protein
MFLAMMPSRRIGRHQRFGETDRLHIQCWRQHISPLVSSFCPEVTSCSQQRMRVLRQCTVPRAEVMFITIQREHIRLSQKEMNNAVVTMLKLPDVCSSAMNHYVSLSLTNRASFVHLYALYSPRTALRRFTSCRGQLVICGQYGSTWCHDTDNIVTSQRWLHQFSQRKNLVTYVEMYFFVI